MRAVCEVLKLLLERVLDVGQVVEVSLDDFLSSQEERFARKISHSASPYIVYQFFWRKHATYLQPISCCGPHTLPCSQFKYCWIGLCFIGQFFSNFFVSFVSTVVPGTRWDVNATNSDLASLLWVNSSLRLTAWSSACRGPFSAGATLAFLLSQLYRSGFAQLDLD